MKALVKTQAAEGLELRDIPVSEYGVNDVLIKIEKTSICGTDVHIWNWDEWAQKTIPVPMTVGHEFVGVVEAFGSNVHDVRIGDLVSGLEGHIVCGRCRNCLAGRRHLCMSTSGVGVNRPGAFAEYLVIPVTNVWHCNPEIPTDVLSCFEPARQCHAHRFVLSDARRGRTDYRSRADWNHGSGDSKTLRRALYRHYRRQPLPSGFS